MVENELVAAARALDEALRGLRFGEPVTHVYRPLEYAWGAHEAYLTRCGGGKKRDDGIFELIFLQSQTR